MDGIEVNANTRDIEQLILAGWEQDTWVLLLGALLAVEQISPQWLPAYVKLIGDGANVDNSSKAIDLDPSHPTHDLMQLVQVAAESYPESVWTSHRWYVQFRQDVVQDPSLR